MRSVVASTFGPLEQLAVVERPDPAPGAGELLIAVEAAGVNFVDALICQGLYQIKPPLPYTPGSEAAGKVAAVGAGVDGLAPGDRVLALPASGGYATHLVVRAGQAIPVPATMTSGQAAGFVQSYATMHYALTRRTTVMPGEWVAVLGAGGGIGLAAVDLATAAEARVVACASSEEKLALARAAGAEATIAYDDDTDLKTAIRDVSGGGVTLVVDPVGGARAEPALRALRWGGRYLVLGFAAGQIPRIPLNQVLLNSRTVIGVEWGAWVARDPAGNQALVAEILASAAAGRLHPVEPSAHPLEDAAGVLDDLQRRRIAGKVVLTP